VVFYNNGRDLCAAPAREWAKNRAKNDRFSLPETVGIVPAAATGNCLPNLELSYNMLAGFEQFSRERFQLSRVIAKTKKVAQASRLHPWAKRSRSGRRDPCATWI